MSPEMEGRLFTPEAVRRYVLAGNSTFTLRSVRTGTRYTYKARRREECTDLTAPAWKRNPAWYVSVLTGDDNENSFSYMGMLEETAYVSGSERLCPFVNFRHTTGSKIGPEAPSAIAFAWFWKTISQSKIPETLEIWHEGRCGVCGRKLTVPESVAAGIGPDCAEKGGY